MIFRRTVEYRLPMSFLCSHPNFVCVDSTVNGEVIAKLCTDCDTQLPADWRSTPISGSMLSFRGWEQARDLFKAADARHASGCITCRGVKP